MPDEQPKKKNQESRAFLGSREQVTSTGAGETPTTPRDKKKTA